MINYPALKYLDLLQNRYYVRTVSMYVRNYITKM